MIDELSRALGGANVENLRRLGGGASREIWAFDAVMPGDERRALVFRRDRAGAAFGHVDEAALLRAAAAVGVPVPRVVCATADGFVMEHVDGETIPRRILRDETYASARDVMAAQCGEILARLHAIDPPATMARPEDLDVARGQIEALRALLDSYEQPHPAFELAMRWLHARAPRARRLALVHGDFRNGNFIVGPEGIRAVLDWELAHAGDPLEDLGWLCVKSWRFGRNDAPVGGFGTREDLFAAYEKAGGDAVDPETVRFWEVYGTLRWGVICIVQAFTHIRGHHRSVELAAIGRRVCETEWDVLELIEEPA